MDHPLGTSIQFQSMNLETFLRPLIPEYRAAFIKFPWWISQIETDWLHWISKRICPHPKVEATFYGMQVTGPQAILYPMP